jgi:hypothetical protein
MSAFGSFPTSFPHLIVRWVNVTPSSATCLLQRNQFERLWFGLVGMPQPLTNFDQFRPASRPYELAVALEGASRKLLFQLMKKLYVYFKLFIQSFYIFRLVYKGREVFLSFSIDCFVDKLQTGGKKGRRGIGRGCIDQERIY